MPNREGKVPGAAEVWGLARVETKAPVAADKADGPDVVAVAALAEAGDKAVLPELSIRLLEQLAEDKMPAAVTMGTNEAGEFTYTFTN